MENTPNNRLVLYVVNVEGIVYRPQDNRYLMMVRGAGEEYLPGFISFPGRKIEGAEFVQDVL